MKKEHETNCRCFDCKKELVHMIMPGGARVAAELVVIRTELGNCYLSQSAYEGPALMLS